MVGGSMTQIFTLAETTQIGNTQVLEYLLITCASDAKK